MSRVLRPNYAQRFLLPPALDEWVPADHPVRFVRDFVDAQDLSALGIQEPAAEQGRPPYAPDLLLKVWLFGYMERIRSTRALEKACLQVMPFLWLTGNLHPDHNTLWRFFDTHRKVLPKLFKQLVQDAAETELLGFVLHALDGTKMMAVSSTDEALHRKAVLEKLQHLDAFIAAYMKEVSTRAEPDKGEGYAMPKTMADEATRQAKIRALLERRLEDRQDRQLLGTTSPSEAKTPPPKPGSRDEPAATRVPTTDREEPPPGEGPRPSGPSLPPSKPPADPLLREAEVLKKELEDQLCRLDTADTNHLHEAEPEARMMKGRGMHALGYNAQIVVDHDSDLIVACNVVAEANDTHQLVPMLERVHETFGRVAEQTAGDTGYANGEQLLCAEANPWPVLVGLPEESDAKGEYSKAHVQYDAASNVYVCPRGEWLVQVGTSKSHATSPHADAIYLCKNRTCPVRAPCTKDKRGRKIRRPYGEEARERQAQKQRDPRMRVWLSLRKEIVEHLFGLIKGRDGLRRFTVRGLEKVNAQWALECLAVNLRKLSARAFWKGDRLVPRSPSDPSLAPA